MLLENVAFVCNHTLKTYPASNTHQELRISIVHVCVNWMHEMGGIIPFVLFIGQKPAQNSVVSPEKIQTNLTVGHKRLTEAEATVFSNRFVKTNIKDKGWVTFAAMQCAAVCTICWLLAEWWTNLYWNWGVFLAESCREQLHSQNDHSITTGDFHYVTIYGSQATCCMFTYTQRLPRELAPLPHVHLKGKDRRESPITAGSVRSNDRM